MPHTYQYPRAALTVDCVVFGYDEGELKVLLMTGYAQDPPPDLLRDRHIETLHKPFNLDRLCELAAEMTA